MGGEKTHYTRVLREARMVRKEGRRALREKEWALRRVFRNTRRGAVIFSSGVRIS